MSPSTSATPLAVLAYPYAELIPFSGSRHALKDAAREPGSAVLWSMGSGRTPPELELLRTRPGGLALLVMLPEVCDLSANPALIHAVQQLRPHGILPHHIEPSAIELAHILRRPPIDLPAEITDYLSWRGLHADRNTVHLIRRIVELSEDLRSVSALARSMYMSRRALGRRFMTLGLPVPSHWLQMARLLRVALRLQNSDASVFSVAYEFGYPDGFSVSNQMSRLLGYRPTEVRERLGWEWLFEAWLRREAECGALAPTMKERVSAGASHGLSAPPTMQQTVRPGRRIRSRA
jgi:AraC-like DNA-binding protein